MPRIFWTVLGSTSRYLFLERQPRSRRPHLYRPPLQHRRAGEGGGVAMPRTPARVTQADVARAIRAAKQAGAGEVRIQTDGTIVISTAPQPPQSVPKTITVDDEGFVQF